MDAPVIDLDEVAKVYPRGVHALRGVAMQARPGEIFGLLGPNGAGKSTLVKIMMTVVRPTRARGTLLGQPIGHKPTLARVGYLPERVRFPPYLTGRQAVEFFAALAKVDRRTRRRRAAELLSMVGLERWADAKIGTYSKGMLQRAGLAQALANDPDLILLDEPTEGLDPVSRREIRELLAKLRDRGKTVFLNSHLLGEVERVCDRVAILLAGRVVKQGTIEDLTAGSEHYEIELGGGDGPSLRQAVRTALGWEPATAPASPAAADPAAETGKLPSGETVELAGTTLRIITGNPLRVQPVIDALRRAGLVIHAMRPVRQTLEDFFIQTVTGLGPEGSAAGSPLEGGRP
jgi:ABC-2 type transport system ATP-binding protein